MQTGETPEPEPFKKRDWESGGPWPEVRQLPGGAGHDGPEQQHDH